MSPLSKVKRRRLAARKKAAEILQSIVSGNADVYIAYRGLYNLWCSNNAAVQELRLLFRIDGIEPDGFLSVTEEFRAKVYELAKEILPRLSRDSVGGSQIPVSFPDDVNVDVFRRMQESGVDFSEPREFDFKVVFPSKSLAETFVKRISELGYAASVEESDCVAELPWEATIKRTMLPTHANVSEFEGILADLARPLGGRNDWWGTLVPPSH